MSSPAGLFCAHKRLRTACPECRPPPPPPPAPRAKAAPKPVAKAADAEVEEGDAEEGASARRGPGKPLMPTKRRAKAPTREEADKAEAWWVKDRK